MIGRGSRWNGGIDGGTELPVTATFMFFNENDLKFVCFLRKIYYFARRLADDINKSTRHTNKNQADSIHILRRGNVCQKLSKVLI